MTGTAAVLERRTVVARPAAPDGRGVLPAWPLIAMVAGYPVEWALGATAFASLGIAVVMAVFLLVRGRLRPATGLLPWGALILWVLACAVGLHTLPQAIGYAQRLGDLVAAGVAGLYYMNARERITPRTAIAALVVLWVVVVLLGFGAIAMPNLRLQTPVSFLVPDGLKTNSLVSQLIYPPMAEVQQPWGAAVPFNRPAAPFPYANSWGAAYAILTPVVVAYLALRPARPVRWALGALLVASLYPAIQTSNRGMLLGLGVAITYVVLRLALRGRLLATAGAAAAVAVAGGYLLASGALQGILARQQVSDSTGTRADLYTSTFSATLQSPFLGWASPQTDVSIGYPLGSQGHAWTLMYSYGFVGLGLFLVFLIGAVVSTGRAPGTPALWLHSSLVMLIPLVWLYGLGTAQTIAMVVLAAILLRARSGTETIR
ncbi:O-antigen ligase domain-containing protein [Amnibacterium sp.]|uniref:O-antigen ligase domain-containing protein n=1 Tax=Amnibacterium sp. TaxID=1872496 RepID=UPI002627250E|nr:O-antigen ligase domain-containing protein [Amnibacterium sp.]MCU1474287.1 hypothetical protein [Amnibacterium sp.]